jgi:hypothetical protein
VFVLFICFYFQYYQGRCDVFKNRVRHHYIHYRTYSIQWCCRKNRKKIHSERKKILKVDSGAPVPHGNVCYQMETSASILRFDPQNSRLPPLKKI